MKTHPHTVPSLSGTLGIRARLALNQKMPKEPSSPSRSITLTEKRCSKIETFELIGRKQPAYNNVSYVIGQQVLNLNMDAFNKHISGLKVRCFEMPNAPYSNR